MVALTRSAFLPRNRKDQSGSDPEIEVARDGWRVGRLPLDGIARKRPDLFAQGRGGLANDLGVQVLCIRIGVGLHPPPPVEIMLTHRLAQKSYNFA